MNSVRIVVRTPQQKFESVHKMATDILAVHRMRNELRQRLTVHLDPDFRLAAGDISGPGLALDFGNPRESWAQLVWNDETDTWDYFANGEPTRKATTVEEAAAHAIGQARARMKRIRRGELRG